MHITKIERSQNAGLVLVHADGVILPFLSDCHPEPLVELANHSANSYNVAPPDIYEGAKGESTDWVTEYER